MKKLFAYMLGIMMLGYSCRKDEPGETAPVKEPEMKYFPLNDTQIKAGSPAFAIDVDNDGRKDLAFGTILIGDPADQMDKLQFLVMTAIGVQLPVNAAEEIPVMKKGEMIFKENFRGYQWFELSSVMLVQKNIPLVQDPFWVGHWRNASHNYVPYQVLTNGKKYNGWVEISVSTIQSRIILHNAAISKVADASVKAGI